MAHYQIFIEGSHGCNPKCLIPVGLGDLLRDDESSPEMVDCPRGPNGRSGVLLTWRIGDPERDPKFMIHAGQQWLPAPSMTHPTLGELPAERYWIGVENNRPPQPRDLAREHMIPGCNITLADGFSWMVPTLSRLPNRYQLNDGGEITRKVKEQYQVFYETGMRVVAEVMDQFNMIEEVRDKIPDIDEFSIPLEATDGMKLIASALALNYRITWELAFMLDMLDEHSGAMALMTFCELSEIRQSLTQKKTLEPILINVGWYS